MSAKKKKKHGFLKLLIQNILGNFLTFSFFNLNVKQAHQPHLRLS